MSSIAVVESTEVEIKNIDASDATLDATIEAKINSMIDTVTESVEGGENETSSDSSESLTKEGFLNDLTELNNLLLQLNKYGIKKFIFTKDELKLCDQTYAKVCTNKEKLNSKMLHINRDAKQIKKATEKVVDENGEEIKKDTSNHAVNIKRNTFPEVLKFMDLPEDTLVSRTDVHRALLDFIKTEKSKENTDIYFDEKKKSYKIVGKMKILFDFIRLEKIKRGKMTEEENLPESITNTDIMKYTGYCFPETEKKAKKTEKTTKTVKTETVA